jgi:large subunit ribosomal protein L29
MDIKEIRAMNDGELIDREAFLKKELFGLRQQSRLGQVEKPSRFGAIRKEVAVILTVLNERKKSNGNKR